MSYEDFEKHEFIELLDQLYKQVDEGESPSKLIEIAERNLHLSKKEYNR